MSLFTDEVKCEGGWVEFSRAWPERPGVQLYAQPASVLPPLDAVFFRGSELVGDWLQANDWERDRRYNHNFKDEQVANQYEQVWFSEYPLYLQSDIYAVLGGWHFPGPDDDWHDLVENQLLVLTIRDAEPWVEAWRTRDGGFRVLQRVT
ncbi:MAG: hypothetical protein B7Z73_00210 [Planctomycetia bacterium 21-64-5]|nr:MAG: hypothetical protein B7Z73_00210 [Planctomycetia bacterium 21-64-5]